MKRLHGTAVACPDLACLPRFLIRHRLTDGHMKYECGLHGTPKGCNTIGVFPRRFFSSGHAPPMLLVPTQSQIRIMKIPVNGTPEFARLFQSLNKTEQIFVSISLFEVILSGFGHNPCYQHTYVKTGWIFRQTGYTPTKTALSVLNNFLSVVQPLLFLCI